MNEIENFKCEPVDAASHGFGNPGNTAAKNMEYLQNAVDEAVFRYKVEKLATALFEAFEAHYPEDNLVEQNAYLPTTQLDGNFNLLEIAAQAIKCLDDLS